MTDRPPAECRDARCQAPIIWAITAGRHKPMPVNAAVDPNGNVLLTQSGHGDPIATIVDPNQPPLGGWPGTLHTAHFTDCPGAADWRARKTNRTPPQKADPS